MKLSNGFVNVSGKMYNGFNDFLPRNEHTEKLIKAVKAAADEYMAVPINGLSYAKFEYVIKTGQKREDYEDDYIEHRRRLNVFLVMSLYEDNEVYIKELENILWAICDEFTWCLPAHTHVVKGEKSASDFIEAIDIFAAETAFYLSEAIYLTKRRISNLVYDRVEYELKRRIIAPFMDENLKWAKNNWSGVCASSIGTVMIYLGLDKEFELSATHISECIYDFLESYENDGCCKEGALYWTYGFGFFCYYARLVREYTDSEIDYFKFPKVKAIAQFGHNVFLNKNNVIPFSDAPHELNFNMGLYTLMAKEYGLSVPSEEYECEFGDDVRYRMCHMIRDLFWYDESIKQNISDKKYVYYENAVWYINKSNLYYFAAKGGNNNEPHNHNDLGSFIIYDNGRYIIDDLGWPMYDRKYFNADYRYDNICASAKGHNVPQFDNSEQVCGENGYASLICADEKEFKLDLSNAYDRVGSLQRKFELSPKSILIRDEFEKADGDVAERFVTRIEPRIDKDGSALIGNWRIVCRNQSDVSIAKVEFNPRNNIVKSTMEDTETAYLITFKLCCDSGIIETELSKEG